MQQLEKTINLKVVPIIDRYWYFGVVLVALMFLFSDEQGILAHRLFIGGLIVVFAIHAHFSHSSPLYHRLNQMAIRLTKLSREYADFKVTKSFEKELLDREITRLKKVLADQGLPQDRKLLNFYGDVYDYLEAKAEAIKHNRPNMYDMLTLVNTEVDRDFREQEEKIKANS